MRCAVNNCGNNNRYGNTRKWRYFHFPKDKEQLQKWIDFCGREIANPSTACVCNEHFSPDDFERNMQYELGFTRKNPTILKPGSSPTIRTVKAAKSTVRQERDKVKRNTPKNDRKKKRCSPMKTASEIENKEEFFNANDDVDNNCIEYTIHEELEEYIENRDSPTFARVELEIIDSTCEPQSNEENDIEVIDPESDDYVRNLEIEVNVLRREIFFLKDDRQKLLNEVKALRSTVRNQSNIRRTKKIMLRKTRKKSTVNKVTKRRDDFEEIEIEID